MSYNTFHSPRWTISCTRQASAREAVAGPPTWLLWGAAAIYFGWVFLEDFTVEILTLPAWSVNTLFRLHSRLKTSVDKFTHGFDSAASCFYRNPGCPISPILYSYCPAHLSPATLDFHLPWVLKKILLPGSYPNYTMTEGRALGDSNMQQGWEPLQKKPRPGCLMGAQGQLGSGISPQIRACLSLIFAAFKGWPVVGRILSLSRARILSMGGRSTDTSQNTIIK